MRRPATLGKLRVPLGGRGDYKFLQFLDRKLKTSTSRTDKQVPAETSQKRVREIAMRVRRHTSNVLRRLEVLQRELANPSCYITNSALTYIVIDSHYKSIACHR